jgi:predicted transcriptional regulator
MQINLEPDVAAAIGRLIAGKHGASPEIAANTVLRLVLDPPELLRKQDELRQLIREGIESAERGELYDGDEVFDEILRELEQPELRS